MGRYYDMVKANFNKLRNDEGVMWGSIEMWDKHLEEMLEHHPDKYWEIMRDTHELMCGKHYDREYAEWEVEQMYHIGEDGREYKGERWSIKDASTVMQTHRGQISTSYNDYDLYVALNAQWHDTIDVARRHFDTVEAAEAYIIDEAIAVWLNDQDWTTHDKPWRYFRCKT